MLAKLMPKYLVFVLLISILLNLSGHNSLPANLTQAKIESEILNQAGRLKYNISMGACLLALMFLGVYQAKIDQMPESLKSQFRTQSMVLNFASSYCMNFACTFFHELGHGIAKRIITGRDFKVHVGGSYGSKKCGIIDLKYLSIDGFDPLVGFSSSESYKAEKYTSLQKIIVNLAGGVSGILGYYFLRAVIFFIHNHDFKNALSQSITIDQVVINQLFNMLIPMQNTNVLGSDAAKVWQELGVGENSIKYIADIQPYLQMLAFVALAFKQSASSVDDQRYIADKILIGFSNYFLQGFVQFKSA
jgi:hypothetical protein